MVHRPARPVRTLTLDLRGGGGAELQVGVFKLDFATSSDSLSTHTFPLRDFLDPADPERAVLAARAMAHQCLDRGITLASHQTPEGYPAWWIHAYSFYDGVGQTLPWNRAWLLGHAVSAALDHFQPKCFIQLGGNPDQVRLLQELVTHRKIAFHAEQIQAPGLRARILARYGERMKLGLRIINGLSARRYAQTLAACEILFFSNGALQRSDTGWSHASFQALQKCLDAHGITHRTLYVWNRFHRPRDIRTAADSHYLPMERQYTGRDLAAMATLALRPAKPPQGLSNLPGAEQFGLQGLFHRKLTHFFHWRVPETTRQVNLFLRLLDQARPKLVVISDEIDSQGISLIVACKSRGIPTVALQHGVLHPQHFGYVHDKADQEPPCPFPRPDLTLVYGPYFGKVLERCGHFPSGSLQVTGSPRYDPMVRARHTPRSHSYRAMLGIPEGGPLIVLTTQPLPSFQEREDILESVCCAMRSVPGAVLAIKPHPAEQDLSMHRQALRRHGLPELLLPGVDLLKLFRHADLVVAQSSTTLIEALLMGCPAITLNLTGLPELLPYATSGACLEISQANLLPAAITSMVKDSSFRRPYEVAREGFLRDMLGDLDGASTERSVKALMHFMGEPT